MIQELLDCPKVSSQVSKERAIEFSLLGDRLFDELAARIATSEKKHRLLFEHKLRPELFQQIRLAAATYISACLNSKVVLSEPEMLQRLMETRGQLPNYTGTGLLAPKREQTLEFNLLQKTVSDAFFQLGANDLIDAVDLPVNVRVVYGKTNSENLRLPFTSSKLHSDVWAGVHADAVVVVLPLFGDIENITIEAGEMPREMELPSMHLMSDFSEGRHIPKAIAYKDAKLQHGVMYFNDARGLHQTVRYKPEGVRISIDFRFRRKFNQAYRAMVPPLVGGFEQDHCIPYEEWLKVGRETLVVFDETVEQARNKQNNAFYLRGHRVVNMFD